MRLHAEHPFTQAQFEAFAESGLKGASWTSDIVQSFRRHVTRSTPHPVAPESKAVASFLGAAQPSRDKTSPRVLRADSELSRLAVVTETRPAVPIEVALYARAVARWLVD